MPPPIVPGTAPMTCPPGSKAARAGDEAEGGANLSDLNAEEWRKLNKREPSGIDIIYDNGFGMWMCLNPECEYTLCPKCGEMRKKQDTLGLPTSKTGRTLRKRAKPGEVKKVREKGECCHKIGPKESSMKYENDSKYNPREMMKKGQDMTGYVTECYACGGNM